MKFLFVTFVLLAAGVMSIVGEESSVDETSVDETSVSIFNTKDSSDPCCSAVDTPRG